MMETIAKTLLDDEDVSFPVRISSSNLPLHVRAALFLINAYIDECILHANSEEPLNKILESSQRLVMLTDCLEMWKDRTNANRMDPPRGI